MSFEITMNSPIGPLQLASDGVALTQLSLSTHALRENSCALLEEAKRQINGYFQGQLRQFDLPLKPHGTLFQQQVWRQLQQIKFGETSSYGEIANRIHNPKAVRAVGMANRSNPIALIIPCHRIIGANRKLVGYAGGISIKKWLLEHEGGWP
ncbi:methylated-DNA--[protein]-cysteine S-methyltransferase [Pseudidiomarina taiwanensis]|uniref:Methylated-DNA--protein-cysteine methyltransferase n=1 Tax=Pseudidiomarina taiwanensis TaxID=337250 RepID=A0A432ZFV1_9GAMM|nr:methylated-DNA--[protein]-cysteine S-methyltransferase [Pseudidiomarina taiwanensis]RUO76801.1 cysteine methyltransferase [Pseudidiomarina taiwanensis]